MTPALVLVALLAWASEPPAETDDRPEGASALAPGSEKGSTEGLEGWRSGIALGWHGTTFWSRESNRYEFQSLAISYLGSRGSTGPLIHLSALLPLQAGEDGSVVATSSVYQDRWGADLLLGRQWRWQAGKDFEAEAGPGFHGTLLMLPGRTGYRDFSALLLGLGGATVLRFRPGAYIGGEPLRVGTFASVAFDFYDPLRSNDLRAGLTFRAGFYAGFGGR
jgi:hypothetical protein